MTDSKTSPCVVWHTSISLPPISLSLEWHLHSHPSIENISDYVCWSLQIIALLCTRLLVTKVHTNMQAFYVYTKHCFFSWVRYIFFLSLSDSLVRVNCLKILWTWSGTNTGLKMSEQAKENCALRPLGFLEARYMRVLHSTVYNISHTSKWCLGLTSSALPLCFVTSVHQ